MGTAGQLDHTTLHSTKEKGSAPKCPESMSVVCSILFVFVSFNVQRSTPTLSLYTFINLLKSVSVIVILYCVCYVYVYELRFRFLDSV